MASSLLSSSASREFSFFGLRPTSSTAARSLSRLAELSALSRIAALVFRSLDANLWLYGRRHSDMEVIPAVAEPAGAKPGKFAWSGAIGILSYLAPMGKLPGIKPNWQFSSASLTVSPWQCLSRSVSLEVSPK